MRPGVSIVSRVIPGLLLVVTGCTAGADAPSPTDPHGFTTTTTPATTTTTVTIEQGLTNYRNCLAEEGISIGEIPIDGMGRPRMATALADLDFTDRIVLNALEVCAHHLSSGALDLGTDTRLRDLVAASLEEFTACLRRNGVDDYPDPVAGFEGVGSPYPVNQIPWSDPELSSAVAACVATLRLPGDQ